VFFSCRINRIFNIIRKFSSESHEHHPVHVAEHVELEEGVLVNVIIVVVIVVVVVLVLVVVVVVGVGDLDDQMNHLLEC